jgi:lipopolysaccharide O-acetyltransferase
MDVKVQNQSVVTGGVTKTLQRYGFIGTIRLIRDVLLSKLVSKNVRLIRYPYYFRGQSFIRFGKGFTSGVGLRIDAFGGQPNQVIFGCNVELGDYVHIGALESVVIGDNVLMASKVYISDHDHGVYQGRGDEISPANQIQSKKPLHIASVHIGNNVWLGENVCVLKGVHIGDNSIIGASSVVTKSIPANSIAIGTPARVVKQYDAALKEWVPVNG